jgi:hypothetical protein
VYAEETRIRWVQNKNYSDSLLTKVKGIYNSDDVIGHLLNLFGINWEKKKADAGEQCECSKREGEKQCEHVTDQGGKQWEEAKRRGSEGAEKAGQWAQDTKGDVKEKVGEKVKGEGQKIKGEL